MWKGARGEARAVRALVSRLGRDVCLALRRLAARALERGVVLDDVGVLSAALAGERSAMNSTVNRARVVALVDRLEAGDEYLTFHNLAEAFGMDFMALLIISFFPLSHRDETRVTLAEAETLVEQLKGQHE